MPMKSPITSSYSAASGRVVGLRPAVALCAIAFLLTSAMATEYLWTGGGDGVNWSDGARGRARAGNGGVVLKTGFTRLEKSCQSCKSCLDKK